MCGIMGVVYRDRRHVVDQGLLAAARDTLRHRGPDEEGLWAPAGAGVGLAHRRLSVLDLSHGQQPMVTPDDRHALVYNGEVYNYRDLQKDYRAKGLSFETTCDTELVFKALNHGGAAALEQFNGMFAFGHWDNKERALLLVRDRLGKKPLYWYGDKDQFVFASELKALLEFLKQKFEVDPVALDQFFTRGYVLAPRTIFRGIHKLAAGCLLRLDGRAESWGWKVEEYWDWQPGEKGDPDPDPAATLDRLDELLTDAVKIRLVSDVPIGCLLSGGIDSSLVTALAAKVSSDPVKAFSIGFEETPQFNELPYAEAVAKRHNCQWFSRNVPSGDFMGSLEDVAPYFDEPFGNFTVTCMRRLAQMAREQLVVVLTGNGGDELAAGYPGRYDWVLQTQGQADNAASRWHYAPALDDVIAHLGHTSFIGWPRGREAIYAPSLIDATLTAGHPLEGILNFWDRNPSSKSGLDRLGRVLYTDVKTNLADYLICIEERMTMSCSLEARNPLLDYRVVDALLSLPTGLKVRNGQHKWALYELAKRYVPLDVLNRPKRGFSPPMGLWLTQHASRLARFFETTGAPTRKLYSDAWWKYLTTGQYDQGATMPLFYSLMLALWTKQYGQYVSSWPAETSPASKPEFSKDGPWQRNLRLDDPAANARSRWFCQALNNFPAGARILLVGDEEGWYTSLARRSGKDAVARDTAATPCAAVSNGEAFAGVMLLGLPAIGQDEEARTDWSALAPGGTLLMFAPFLQPAVAQAERLLNAVAGRFKVLGHQGVNIGPDEVCLIARFQLPGTLVVPEAAAKPLVEFTMRSV